MGVLLANNAASTLAAGIDTTTTVITLAAGEGAKFPSPGGSDWFPVVLQRIADYRQIEIVRCTGRTGDQLTIARAQEGTAALTFIAGDIVDHRLTAAAIAAINADLLDGQEGSFYRDASNLNAGILPAARFNDTAHGSRGGGSLHSAATTSAAGFMSTADKTKLDGIEAGAQVNVATNLGQSRTETTYTVTSSTGSNTSLAAATGTLAGVMSAADKTKLDGIAAGATANATDAQLRDRATHTGAQAISTVTGLQAALDGKSATGHGHTISDVSGLGTAATQDTGQSVGQVMQVGAFGLGTVTRRDYPFTSIDSVAPSGFYYATLAQGFPLSPDGHLIVMSYSTIWSIQIAYDYRTGRQLVRSLSNNVWQPWRETISSHNLLQSTGTSTTFPMSQKAVTDQLATALGDHKAEVDPHTQYVQKVTGKGLSTEDYTTAERDKLAGIEAGAQVNVATNLGTSASSTTVTVTSSTGGNTSLAAATTSLAGVMTAADKSKLNGIESGAQVNVATNLSHTLASTSVTVNSSTGSDTAIPGATTSVAGVMVATDKSKLNAVGTNANRNLTISTSTPTGGADGDVWYQYE